jgi:hypothetical protein
MADSTRDAADAPPPAPANEARPPLGRRLLMLNLAAGATAATTAAPAAAIEPTPAQYRTGLSDADPNDAPGYGRGGYRGRPRTGLNDGDPNDPAGYGRGYRRGNVTDSDPSDAAGRGRGWR